MLEIVWGTAAWQAWREELPQQARRGSHRQVHLLATRPQLEHTMHHLMQARPAWWGEPAHLVQGFVQAILDDCGQILPPEIDPQDVLQQYGLATRYLSKKEDVPAGIEAKTVSMMLPGLSRSLSRLILECKRAGLTVEQARRLRGGPQWQRFQPVFIAYEQFLEQWQLCDREDRIHAALGCIRDDRSVWLQSIDELWISGFGRFTPAQQSLVAALVEKIPTCRIYYQVDVDDEQQQQRQETLAWLRTLAPEMTTERRVDRNGSVVPSSIRIHTGARPQDEVRGLLDWLRCCQFEQLADCQAGLQTGQLAIAARNPGDYVEWVARAVQAEGWQATVVEQLPLYRLPLVSAFFHLVELVVGEVNREKLLSALCHPMLARKNILRRLQDVELGEKMLSELSPFRGWEALFIRIDSRLTSLQKQGKTDDVERWQLLRDDLAELHDLLRPWPEEAEAPEWVRVVSELCVQFDLLHVPPAVAYGQRVRMITQEESIVQGQRNVAALNKLLHSLEQWASLSNLVHYLPCEQIDTASRINTAFDFDLTTMEASYREHARGEPNGAEAVPDRKASSELCLGSPARPVWTKEQFVQRLRDFAEQTVAYESMVVADDVVSADQRLLDTSSQSTSIGSAADGDRPEHATAAEYSPPLLRIVLYEPAQLRGLSFDYVAVLGLGEGTYPKQFQSDWLLPDAERRLLAQAGLPLETTEDLRLRETLSFFDLLDCCRNELLLSVAAEEEEVWPEWLRQLELTPATGEPSNDAVIEGGEQKKSSQQIIAYPPRAVELLRPEPLSSERRLLQLRAIMALHVDGDDPNSQIVIWSEWLRKRLTPLETAHCELALRVAREREAPSFGAWDGDLDEELLKEQLATYFSDDYAYSVSQINEYARCSFSFFGRYVLGLQPDEEVDDEPEARELGTMLHDALARFLQKYRGRTLELEQLPEYEQELESELERAWERAAEHGREQHGRYWQVTLSSWQRRLRYWLRQLIEQSSSRPDGLRPWLLEWSFPSAQVGPLRLQPEETGLPHPLNIRGVIDRIDRDDAGTFAVYDYKLGRGPSRRAMFEGWEFQIPLYLLAVQRLLPEAGEPAGGGYYSLLNLDANNGIWDESLLKLLGMSSNISGKLSRKEIDALLAETTRRVGRLVSELRRGVFHLRPHECPDYCSFRDICRIDAHGKRVVTSVGEEAADETNGSTTTRH